jgi:hypothetical protein
VLSAIVCPAFGNRFGVTERPGRKARNEGAIGPIDLRRRAVLSKQEVESMSAQHDRLVLNSALKQLAEEARLRAAAVPMRSPEHAFYNGVLAAAGDRLHPLHHLTHDGTWLARQSPAFREGYTRTSINIATFGRAPLRLHLPAPPTFR